MIGKPTVLISALSDIAFLKKCCLKSQENSENYNRGKSQNLTFQKTENLHSNIYHLSYFQHGHLECVGLARTRD